MFKKSDPWEAGFKMVSKFLGFDVNDQPDAKQPVRKASGILSLQSKLEMSVGVKSEQKSFQLKQKWRKLMKFPSKAKYHEVIELLREGSAIEDQTWTWMLKNTQKISPQLYSHKKQLLNQILYSNNQNVASSQMNFQIQDFEQNFQFGNRQKIRQGKKRKFSITKNGMFLKSHSGMEGRMSLNSQASTFSTQNSGGNERREECNGEKSMLDSLMVCSKQSTVDSPQKNSMKTSYMSSYSNTTEPFSIQPTPSVQYIQQSPLVLLPQKISHPVLTSIIGSFLLHRQEFSYSITLFNLAATFFYYTNSNQMKTFILLNHVACSQFFVHYLTQSYEESSRIIVYIAQRVRLNCPCSKWLQNFVIQNFIENWFYGFFYSICQNGTQIKEKIIGYLLINAFSVESLAKVCQSLILSLSKVISSGIQDKIYQCLQNPKFYIDKQVLFYHLLKDQQ